MKVSHVIGPPGCGKTLNRELIAEYLGCDTIIDDDTEFTSCGEHVLMLKSAVPTGRGNGDPVYSFFELRKRILADPACTHRWRQPDEAAGEPGISIKVTPTRTPEDYLKLIEDISEKLETGSGAQTPDPAMPALKQGDVVQLRSGGAAMTVLHDTCSETKTCGWFAGGIFQEEDFHASCLRPDHGNIPF